MAVLEGSGAVRIKEPIKNIVHSHLTTLDHNPKLERFYWGPSLPNHWHTEVTKQDGVVRQMQPRIPPMVLGQGA